jgi:hypothetical protein
VELTLGQRPTAAGKKSKAKEIRAPSEANIGAIKEYVSRDGKYKFG